MKKFSQRILFAVLVIIWISVFAVGQKLLSAESVEASFNENDRYDIYFDYDLVKSVKILGTREINDVTFVVITNSNLRSKGTEGFIRLDSIQAILPSGYISNIQNSGIRYK